MKMKVREFLESIGADGLAGEDCGCGINDLCPCGEGCGSCFPAKHQIATESGELYDVGDEIWIAIPDMPCISEAMEKSQEMERISLKEKIWNLENQISILESDNRCGMEIRTKLEEENQLLRNKVEVLEYFKHHIHDANGNADCGYCKHKNGIKCEAYECRWEWNGRKLNDK